jgi:hypothetical protein
LGKTQGEVALGFCRAISESEEGPQPAEQIRKARGWVGLLVPEPRPVGGSLNGVSPESPRSKLDTEFTLCLALLHALLERAYGWGIAMSAVRLT